MGKGGGRRRDDVWRHVKLLEGGRRVKCKYCEFEFAASANRIKSHIEKDESKGKGKGIRVCTGKGNPNNDLEQNPLHSEGQNQADGAVDQQRIQVGSSFVSDGENEDLQMMKRYVLECLRPEEKVFISPLSHLTQEEFMTLKPEAHLDSFVINIFVEILTESEKKKATPSNCYLPVTFSTAALESDEHKFSDFVSEQKFRENYLFGMKPPEKMFVPVHVGSKKYGHFYLYIVHLKKEVIEIWDSLPKFVAETERVKTKEKLLFAMEILFKKEKGAFSNYEKEMANDILIQDNGFDCGVFVINYMQQSDNYMKKRNHSFQFDSNKEREDLVLKLLTSDLNQAKKNLYDKARRHFAQVEKQDDNKRLRVDTSEESSEDVGSEPQKESDDSDAEDDVSENDLIGRGFQRYTEQIRKWIKDDKVSAIGVWGMGGSGKTALATHVYDKLVEEADTMVIWVTISQNSISHLQKVIARSIKLDISDEFEDKIIARKLCQAFKEMKKCVVIILDDVWDHFFLKEIGFPMSDNRIRLILTTRIWDVCQGMDCKEKIIEVRSLYDEDSWALFKKILGFHEEMSLEVKEIAWEVACKCEGLPLAIARIATSMKGGKQAIQWSHMLECLGNLSNGQYEIGKWVLPILRSSYDFLTDELQRFFLYCALSIYGPFDYDEVNHLIRRFVYVSIDETKMLGEQYNEGFNMLDKLTNHSMLERYDMGWWGDWHRGGEMNGFLRVLAIGIAKDKGTIMANAYKDLKEIPSDDRWKDDLREVFLSGKDIKTIPNDIYPKCSQLSTLLLDKNKNLNYISDEFFNNMPALRTLDLSNTGIQRLPESLSNLKCLVTLLLSRCDKLSYIPSLEKLKGLKSLDLSYTTITEAPMGLESLVKLRYLNLIRIDELVMSALDISKLMNLEHLEMTVTIAGTQDFGEDEVRVAYFRDISVVSTSLTLELERYDLTLRGASAGPLYQKINREYSMNRITLDHMILGNIRAELPEDLKELFIKNCQLRTGGRYLCSSFSSSYGLQIEGLHIEWCREVEYLCCLSGSCPFCFYSKLGGRVSLDELHELKDLVPPDAVESLHESTLFSHLKHLSISGCISMETLLTPKLLENLPNLRTILVDSCLNMTEIIVGDDHSEMQLPSITLPNLTSLQLVGMPLLNYVYRGLMLCPSLQTFSADDTCEQLNPPQIKISSDGCLLQMKKTHSGYLWQFESY